MRKRATSRCLAILVILASLSAQESRNDKRFSKSASAGFQARTAAIAQELQEGNQPEWAGEYYYGDGLGVNVTLKLSSQDFVFSWDGCLGRYDQNYGEVTFEDGTVKLAPKHPNNRVGFQGIDVELFPVVWGERHYLISSERVMDFVNAVNAGTEPADWRGGLSPRFLLKRGDDRKPVHGKPDIPDEYLAYLLSEPVKATIASVQPSQLKKSTRITMVTLDAGAETGLKKGMELFVSKPRNIYSAATITSVGDHFAEATFESERSERTPAVGWELSSKLE